MQLPRALKRFRDRRTNTSEMREAAYKAEEQRLKATAKARRAERNRLTGVIDAKLLFRIAREDFKVETYNQWRLTRLSLRGISTDDLDYIVLALQADAWLQRQSLPCRLALGFLLSTPVSRPLLRYRARRILRILSKPLPPQRQYRPIREYLHPTKG